MDAGMGAVTAVQDMLIHSRRNVVFVLPGVPKHWKNVSFKGMPCEGGFSISAEKKDGKICNVTVHSSRGGSLKIGNPWNEAQVQIKYNDGRKEHLQGKILDLELPRGTACEMACTQK